jgi:hypothetical protein
LRQRLRPRPLRRDVQDFVDGLSSQGLSPSTIANVVDPLRVIFRRAIRRDEIAVDPTENLDLPAIRGRRARIEPPEIAHERLVAVPGKRTRLLGRSPLLRPAPRRANAGCSGRTSTSRPASSASSDRGIQSKARSTSRPAPAGAASRWRS